MDSVGIVFLHVSFNKGSISDDDIEYVVEIVGDAAGQCSDGLHLLGLDQLGLQALAIGDVQKADDEVALPVLRLEIDDVRFAEPFLPVRPDDME